ncbi:methyl accepting chemotaxis protein [Phenylobacterium zucineum HLK1]|uniref:Methyl accepting chemotaxis protein n=1 Tax=Phenylobacterium zucineum (strain HLK1) TaxID=450851 RepID=B4REB7_PHEZH|nr:methyl-accepting chemotaxis protein [Phenylobacterium zucineum]ACG76859.1 methyl accepting chemotaxis protein [Phenylobacterium zucineum HLK1]
MTSTSSAADAPSCAACFEAIGRVLQQAARGDLEGRVSPLPEDAEAREVAEALNALLDLTDAYVRESRAALQHVAEGVYYRRVMEQGLLGSFGQAAGVINQAMKAMGDKVAGVEALRGSLLQIADEVASSAGAVETSAQGLAELVGRVRQSAAAIDGSARNTNENVSGVVAATEQLSASISGVGSLAGSTSQVSRDVVDRARTTAQAMVELQDASEQINAVVALIREVASQTNLLSLNAMIEATRAGDAGRGFAVVAGEVKALARQTGEATVDITHQIQSVQELTRQASAAISGVQPIVDQLASMAEQVSVAVEQQSEATQEISGHIHQAAEGAREVAGEIGEITEAIGGADQAAQEMFAAAQMVAGQATRLRAELDGYLGGSAP